MCICGLRSSSGHLRFFFALADLVLAESQLQVSTVCSLPPYSMYVLSWILECCVRSHTRSKALSMMFVKHLFVWLCNRHALNCRKYGIKCSVEEEKKLNSQTKFLFIRLWDYFEQEVRKLKVSRGEEERNLEATPPSPL